MISRKDTRIIMKEKEKVMMDGNKRKNFMKQEVFYRVKTKKNQTKTFITEYLTHMTKIRTWQIDINLFQFKISIVL